MKKIAFIAVAILIFILTSPMFNYWWGLSNLDGAPVASNIKLSAEQEYKIWKNEYAWSDRDSRERCESLYPGLRLAFLAVRTQVSEKIKVEGNTAWQFTWLAYGIWATNNWSIHQILATYHASARTQPNIENTPSRTN